jgi:UDP:flavonoid glycosyltransferase YjiC (YdhE family)
MTSTAAERRAVRRASRPIALLRPRAGIDTTFQLAPPGFEYPRREPDRVRFVGPVRSGARPDPDLPYWWADLDYSLPVVHVTQGTVANANLGQLLVPALRAVAGEDDVLVVAATGGRPLAALTAALGGPLPANARVAEFLPYGDLLPRTAVMITAPAATDRRAG